jgi:hypothetical protein
MPPAGPWFLDAAKGMTPMLRALLAALILSLSAWTAQADYAAGKVRFDRFSSEQQTALTLALIAVGDLEGLAEHGFTRRFYDAVRRFERREGYPADGVLDLDEIGYLTGLAERFYERLGNSYYAHPRTGAKLLVLRNLFDSERSTEEGMLFDRGDGMLSLSFVSFPQEQKSFDALYRTLTASTPDRRVIYQRRFPTHFVATGFFTGRKLSVLLANAFLADPG